MLFLRGRLNSFKEAIKPNELFENSKEVISMRTKKVRILNKGNQKVVVLTKESQGTMYYLAQ